MRIEEKIARTINEQYFGLRLKPNNLPKLFDEELKRAVDSGAISKEDAPHIRAEAARIAAKLRLEELKRRAL